MTAFKDTSWVRLHLRHRDVADKIWTMEGPFTPDTMVGLFLAGLMLNEEMDIRTPFELIGERKNGIQDPARLNFMIRQQYVIYPSVSDFQIDKDRKYKNMLPKPGKIGIWIFSHYDQVEPYENYWNFLEVEYIDEFMQGVITMCEAYGVDFSNYLLYLPIDSNGIEYDIPEYELKEKIMMRE